MKQPPIDDLSIVRREELNTLLVEAAHQTQTRHIQAGVTARNNRAAYPAILTMSYATIAETLNRVTIHVETLTGDAGTHLDAETKTALSILHQDLIRIAANFRSASERAYRSTEQGRAA
ncbi:hypothetical protein [Kocuria sp. TGY1127_2]|uniref:hypothetical protein n=1 Tax=Kocuria sp. TGY1127_2 TaxID=2711328 RepID=UPI0015BDB802|nr:hypothetical protein [Kocuria sp. TGY1127_2]